ncbi:hypothetical protein HS088_TW23G00234 [Tripterygium wilfordii]|uniref:Phorbol-ester/DAG-type domain-containing protein n=1 Tax=Tripterygium wilfordii TaxID=458696 RepID=A0A7J7BUE3_TRIWF|nr:hypothetical protein HS088_TW23G00234 [Tripterygium wilfordii]
MWKIDRANCAACELPVRGEAYDCFTCKFCLHEWCAKELPQEIQQHPLHPSHPLNLLYQSPYEGSVFGCNGCKENCGGFVYHCADCQFDLDVECALDCLDILYNDDHSHSKNKTKKQIINHDSHDHPLTESQIWKSGHDNVLCSGCGLCIDSAEAYSCSLCDFNLHKSCAELPNEINLLHFDANFVLVVKDFVEVLNTGRPISNACKCDVDGFVYFRESTGTMVGVDCAFLKPSLKLDDQLHKHPLTFFEKKIDGLKCNACGDRCLEQIFRCVKCDFNLHFTCAPVLHTIKHECHMDPLTLKKMDNDDETEENYCDACETTRIPKRLVYYCEQCDFAAHIDCVVPSPGEGLLFDNQPEEESDPPEEYKTTKLTEFAFFERADRDIEHRTQQLEEEKSRLHELLKANKDSMADGDIASCSKTVKEHSSMLAKMKMYRSVFETLNKKTMEFKRLYEELEVAKANGLARSDAN